MSGTATPEPMKCLMPVTRSEDFDLNRSLSDEVVTRFATRSSAMLLAPVMLIAPSILLASVCCVLTILPATATAKENRTANAQAQDMQHPIDVAVAPDGTVFVADRQLPGIWQIKDGKRSIYFQAKREFKTPLNAIRCLAIDQDGKLLAGCSSTWMVYRFAEAGKPEPIHTGRIGIPMGIAANTNGDVFVSDIEIGRVVKVAAGNEELKAPEVIQEISAPRGLWVDEQQELWIVNAGNGQLKKVSTENELSTVIAERPLVYPASVAFFNGAVVVCDSFADRIAKVGEDGTLTDLVKGDPLQHPVGMSVYENQLYIVDSRAKAVFVVDEAGKVTMLEHQFAE